MHPQKVVVVRSLAKRERYSKARLRFQVFLTSDEMSSVLEALHDSLFNEYTGTTEPGRGPRTLGGLEADLGLYERLYRFAYGHAPDFGLCDTLKAHLPNGELARVVEVARQRWTV